MTVMMMNDDVDDEIGDSGNHYHIKMGLEYNSQKPFPQQNGFGIPVRWWWWTAVLMMRLEILETISTTKGFGVQLTETISTTKWVWHSGTMMMMNDGVDDEIEDSSGDDDKWRWWFSLFPRLIRFVLFCLVSSGDEWLYNYVGIYAWCIRISLCTITAPPDLGSGSATDGEVSNHLLFAKKNKINK